MVGVVRGAPARLRRSLAKKSSKKRKTRAKPDAVDAYRRRIGVQGRQIHSAIDRTRALLKVVALRRSKRKISKPTEVAEGDIVEFEHFGHGEMRQMTVFAVKECNMDKKVTWAWVLCERQRAERERDRRLSRFIAVPIESVTVKSSRGAEKAD